MGDFKRGGGKRFSGRGGGFNKQRGGRSGSGGGRNRGPVTMHQATCDQCKKLCEVPFRPTSGKPVYCSVCFESKKEVGSSRGRDRFSQRGYDGYKAPGRSDLGSDIHGKNNNEIKKQLEILNGKIDLLIEAVKAMASTKPLVVKKKTKKKVKTASVVKAKKVTKKGS